MNLKKFRNTILILLIVNVTTDSFSQQNYKTALGLRLNGGAGISVRHSLKENQSIEGILYTRWRGLNITGIYSVNYPVFDEPGFNFFIGGGGHIGFWDRDRSPWWDEDKKYGDTRMVLGIDGQIGLEYTFKEIPLNLAIDWKPAFNIIGITNFWVGDAALSVRYTWK
jgi:hypothetical protein